MRARWSRSAKKEPGVVDVDTSLNVGKPELSVQLDRLKAADLGVQIADAAEALRLLVGGDQVTTYNEGGEQYEVHVRAVQGNRQTAAAIEQLTVPSSNGTAACRWRTSRALTSGTAPAEINRLNRQRQVTVFAGLPAGRLADAGDGRDDARRRVAEHGTGLQHALRRPVARARRAAQNFLIAFVLSLVFMYLILAAQFESWLHPITILLSLPLTLPFALLSIIITRQSLNIFSALGLLVLFGVVKKNSILQIDHANQLREQGMERDAAILQASRDRLRPILMTTLAFVAGMIPLVLSSGIGAGTNRAIGFVIIGGQSLVLLLTLLVTPVAYSLFDDLSKVRHPVRRGARRARRRQRRSVLALMLLHRRFRQGAGDRPPRQPAPAAAVQARRRPARSLRITRDDAVRMAVANNPELAVSRYDPAISETEVDRGAERVPADAADGDPAQHPAAAAGRTCSAARPGRRPTTGRATSARPAAALGRRLRTASAGTRPARRPTASSSNFNPSLASSSRSRSRSRCCATSRSIRRARRSS